MKKLLCVVAILTVIISCGTESARDMTVMGTVRGLKKGTLYLQKVQDSILVTVDSMVIDGDANFSFGADLPETDIFYLYLNKKDNDTLNDRIFFFGEKDTIHITTSVERFELDAEIKGSENTDSYQEFATIMKKYRDQRLDLIGEAFNAQKAGDTQTVKEVNRKSEKLLKRSYLYAVNFALNNRDKVVAPYVALTEIYDANPKYLDTIYNTLDPSIKESKFGKELQEYLDSVKE
ncbi:DUF4369 domain-containing protein [Sungkyunkwania multivorans]|uniref:DUF4369 domain-containing protein n=1 Tax=Sungkyunkwania multivorans TaxID=1173618 RepID=A0ABW3CV63_9FLAO